MFRFDVFVYSFVLYSCLRYFDVWSTKLCLDVLDPEMHEVNPIIAPLIKKIGFNKTMILTWLLFAIPIALIDVLFLYPVVGIPILWLLFGLFHLIAAANNTQIHFQVKIFGAEAVKENTRRVVRILKGLPLLRRITFLAKMNFLNLFLAFYGIAALTLFNFFLSATDIAIRHPIPILLAVGPPIMILDLILFFPTIVFGSIMISFRRLRLVNKKDVKPKEDQKYLTVSVQCLEDALIEAQANNAEYVQFLIPSED